MDNDKLELIEKRFRNRYKQKKTVNIIISAVIAILGISSFLFILNYDGDGVLTFRWMTVDGTLFSTAIAVAFVAIGIVEMVKNTELTSRIVYFLRLAAAVAEGLIIVVVLLSQLPFSPQHMHIERFDMFNMHIVIPILTIVSFITNDSPIGKLKAPRLLYGTLFVTLYAITVVALIVTGVIKNEMIPYAFIDVLNMPAIAIILTLAFIYGVSFLLSFLLYRANKKLSWAWFKNIASNK